MSQPLQHGAELRSRSVPEPTGCSPLSAYAVITLAGGMGGLGLPNAGDQNLPIFRGSKFDSNGFSTVGAVHPSGSLPLQAQSRPTAHAERARLRQTAAKSGNAENGAIPSEMNDFSDLAGVQPKRKKTE